MASFTPKPPYGGPRSGFTLIELLVVIAIVALLSSVVLASLNAARDKARIAKVRSEATQIYRAFAAVTADSGADYLAKSNASGEFSNGSQQARWYLPNCSAAQDPDGDDRPNGEYVRQFATAINEYLKSVPVDPWGAPYWIDAVYQCVGGEASGCVAGAWYYAIGSGGPNLSLPNVYDSDNVVVTFCRHP